MVIEVQRDEHKLAKDLLVDYPNRIDQWLAEPIFKMSQNHMEAGNLLHELATKPASVLLKYLLNKKKRQINIDSITNKGNTPLFLACQAGNVDVVKELLLRHADIGLRCQ